MQLCPRSLRNLRGVHPDLVRVVHKAAEITDLDFVVIEGLRTQARQDELFRQGASQTTNGRHVTGHAVDVAAKVGNDIRWDWPLYDRLAKVFKKAAALVNVPIEWGGDWKSFKDGPHFQLPRKQYP